MERKLSSGAQWYALYVMPQSEKKVLDRLTEKKIEAYLPLKKSLRLWSDRKKMIAEPLIRGYVFVKTDLKDQVRVLETQGALQFVRFDHQPAAIPELQIQAMKIFLESGLDIEVEDKILPGEEVEIIDGLLRGMYGQLVEHRGKKIFAVQLGNLSKTLIVAIPASQVRRAG